MANLIITTFFLAQNSSLIILIRRWIILLGADSDIAAFVKRSEVLFSQPSTSLHNKSTQLISWTQFSALTNFSFCLLSIFPWCRLDISFHKLQRFRRQFMRTKVRPESWRINDKPRLFKNVLETDPLLREISRRWSKTPASLDALSLAATEGTSSLFPPPPPPPLLLREQGGASIPNSNC